MPRSVATATMASFASLALRAIVPGNHCFSSHCAHRWPSSISSRGGGRGGETGGGNGAGRVGARTGHSRVPGGPCSRQKSYVRPIHRKRLCASGYSYFNANKRNGTETLAGDPLPPPLPVHRQSVKSPSRVPFKAIRGFPLFHLGNTSDLKIGGEIILGVAVHTLLNS